MNISELTTIVRKIRSCDIIYHVFFTSPRPFQLNLPSMRTNDYNFSLADDRYKNCLYPENSFEDLGFYCIIYCEPLLVQDVCFLCVRYRETV